MCPRKMFFTEHELYHRTYVRTYTFLDRRNIVLPGHGLTPVWLHISLPFILYILVSYYNYLDLCFSYLYIYLHIYIYIYDMISLSTYCYILFMFLHCFCLYIYSFLLLDIYFHNFSMFMYITFYVQRMYCCSYFIYSFNLNRFRLID